MGQRAVCAPHEHRLHHVHLINSLGLCLVCNLHLRPRWVWAKELHVCDLGLYRFKGVLGQHAIVSIATQRTAERQQEPKVRLFIFCDC